MSADLLAAFGLPQPDQETAKTSSSAKTNSTTKDADAGASDVQGEQPWILQSQQIPQMRRQDNSQPLWKQDSKGADVLFDASDDEDQDEDDFGDFEAAPVRVETKTQVVAQPIQHRHTDLLGLDGFSDTHSIKEKVPPPASDYQDIITSNSTTAKPLEQRHFAQRYRQPQPRFEDGWHQSISSSSRHKSQPNPQPQQGSALVDEEWGDFEDVKPKAGHHVTLKKATKLQPARSDQTEQSTDDDEWDTFNNGVLIPMEPKVLPLPQVKATAASQPSPNRTSAPTPHLADPPARPTNIPPPSNILSLLPKVYNTLSQQSRQPNPPSGLAQHTLHIYTTTARLIAGRQHRWKRDTILSQSTRISQAGLKNTGMKLAALDKSETIKEDQEAQEAISSWQRHAATLNAVMLKGKVQKPPMTLSTSMAVRSANGLGVLMARDCCVLCGLKRNERVTGIDVRVEDTFGEFWVEHWGHRDCFEFWSRYEELLDRR